MKLEQLYEHIEAEKQKYHQAHKLNYRRNLTIVLPAIIITSLSSMLSFISSSDIIPDDTHNSLFIWDESHTSQTQGQSMESFYKRIGIEINGDQTEMKRRYIYIYYLFLPHPFLKLPVTKTLIKINQWFS